MRFIEDLSGSAKGAAILAILSLIIGFSLTSTTNLNGVVSCSHFDPVKIGLGGFAAFVGLTGFVQATRDNTSARTMNMTVTALAVPIGIYSVLVGLGLVGGPC